MGLLLSRPPPDTGTVRLDEDLVAPPGSDADLLDTTDLGEDMIWCCTNRGSNICCEAFAKTVRALLATTALPHSTGTVTLPGSVMTKLCDDDIIFGEPGEPSLEAALESIGEPIRAGEPVLEPTLETIVATAG